MPFVLGPPWKVEKGKVFIDSEKMDAGLTKRDLAQMLRDLSA